MIRKPFGSNGAELPEIGQGTWDLPESGLRLEEARRSLRRGIELGMTHVDMAEMYGGGRVEEIVGQTIAGIPRERLFLASKVLPGNASYAGTVRACESSLRRLQTEYLDLYMLHWPGAHPLEETMGALEGLVEQGKTRYIGVSNFDVDQLRAAASYLRRAELACDQLLYHLHERGIETRLMPYCALHGIAVVAYTPFGRGRFPRKAAAAGGVLSRIGERYGKTPRQVILNFLTREPHAFAIPKASRVEHVEENAGAAGWRLEAGDIAEIDAVFPVRDGPLATL